MLTRWGSGSMLPDERRAHLQYYLQFRVIENRPARVCNALSVDVRKGYTDKTVLVETIHSEFTVIK